MGILLTFMFVLNMIGALVLIPAMSHFLLSDTYFRRTPTRGQLNAASSKQSVLVSE
ncbi:hypothetical protein D3C85_1548820 [compost metagenome]